MQDPLGMEPYGTSLLGYLASILLGQNMREQIFTDGMAYSQS